MLLVVEKYLAELPRWLNGRESTCQAGDMNSVPGSEHPPGEENGSPLRYSHLENPVDRGAWQAPYSPWGGKESDVTEQVFYSM